MDKVHEPLEVVWMEVPYPDHRAVCYTHNTNGITVSIIESRLMAAQ